MDAASGLMNIQTSFLADFIVSLSFTVVLAQSKCSQRLGLHLQRKSDLQLLLRLQVPVCVKPGRHTSDLFLKRLSVNLSRA